MPCPDLTPEQDAAIRAFAKRHGGNWKATLRDLWMRAAASPDLHSLRNTHGPAWLAAFQIDKARPDA